VPVSKELTPQKRLELFSGRSNLPLARAIADHLGVRLGESNLSEFADGEIHCRFGESIRGTDVFIVQTHSGPVNDSIMEQLIMIDAAKRASAKRITAVCPYYGYARQDRKSSGREPITAKLVADMLSTAGVDRVVSVDLHSGQIQGFFDVPVDHLTAMPILTEYVQENFGPDVVIVSPDAGRAKHADRFARHLNADLAIVDKRRQADTGEVVALGVMGDVAGRVCVLVDDQISTAGTMVAAAEQLARRRATEVHALATHGIFAGPAIDRIKNSAISRVVVTDTVPLADDCRIDKIEVLSVAGIIADALEAVFEDLSVSEIFGGENQA
jgi:ribose-phosphate pyrophosphokinase